MKYKVTCSVVFVPVRPERRAAWRHAIQILGSLVVADALERIKAESSDPGGEVAALEDGSGTGVEDIALPE